jgi:accessory colonization factor AcfC
MKNKDDINLILKTDEEIFKALLRGCKIKKLNSVNTEYIYLKEGYLIDQSGIPSTLYRLNKSEVYIIIK